MRVWPLRTLRPRMREVRTLREASTAVREARGSGSLTAHTKALQKEFKQWSRRAAPFLDEVESAILKNRNGHHFEGEFLALRGNRLVEDFQALCEIDARQIAEAEQCREIISKLHVALGGLHPRFRKEIEGAVRFARGKLGDIRTNIGTPAEVNHCISEIQRRLTVATERVKFAADVDARIANLECVKKHAEELGTPATQAWRQFVGELEIAARHAFKQREDGLYEAADHFLNQVGNLESQIEAESNLQRRRAHSEIAEWSTYRELTPSMQFHGELEGLSQRDDGIVTNKWPILQEKISEDVRRRYLMALEENQQEIKRIHELRKKPFSSLQLTGDPASPRLDWAELRTFASEMATRCSLRRVKIRPGKQLSANADPLGARVADTTRIKPANRRPTKGDPIDALVMADMTRSKPAKRRRTKEEIEALLMADATDVKRAILPAAKEDVWKIQ